MVLDVVFVPILTELWPWEGQKLKLGKCSNWICFRKNLFLFLALFFIKIIKIVLKNCLTIFLRFLAFQNSHWSSKYDKIHGSDYKFKFLFQNKGLPLWVVWAFSPLILAKIKKFWTVSRPKLSLYWHKNNIQEHFWKLENKSFHLAPRLMGFLLYCGRCKLLKFWPKFYLPHCTFLLEHSCLKVIGWDGVGPYDIIISPSPNWLLVLGLLCFWIWDWGGLGLGPGLDNYARGAVSASNKKKCEFQISKKFNFLLNISHIC